MNPACVCRDAKGKLQTLPATTPFLSSDGWGELPLIWSKSSKLLWTISGDSKGVAEHDTQNRPEVRVLGNGNSRSPAYGGLLAAVRVGMTSI